MPDKLNHFSEVFVKEGGISNAYHLRGLCYDSMGNRDLTLKDFNESPRHDSTYGLSYSARGSIFMREGKYKMALRDFDRVIKFEPEEGVSYYLRGLLYMNHFKNKESACKDYLKASKYNFSPVLKIFYKYCRNEMQ